MKKIEFNASDFDGCTMGPDMSEVADAAQAIFNSWYAENIKSAPRIWFIKTEHACPFMHKTEGWPGDTHTALLVDIKEIEK